MEVLTQYGINLADVIVLSVMILGFIIGRNKGIVKMSLRIVYGLASFGASVLFYPMVSGIIRSTPIFELIKEKTIDYLGLEAAVETYTRQQEASLITSLSLPQPVKDKLLENNNSVIYDLIGADGIVDYIAGFVANLVINVVLVWLLFIIFLFALRLIMRGLELAARLPVINGINRLGGALMGTFASVCFIWLFFIGIYAFIARPGVYNMYSAIASSRVALWLYDNNPLLTLILKRLF